MISSPKMPSAKSSFQLHDIGFCELDGWLDDDHAAAFNTFLKTCNKPTTAGSSARRAVDSAMELGPNPSRDQARTYFETYFTPLRVIQTISPGLVTGYFEPELCGSRSQNHQYQFPVHKRPADLVNLVNESERGALHGGLSHARKTGSGTETFPTRKQIDCGALDGQDLEICFLKDPVDRFFMQVQGSGLIKFDNETPIRLTYDGKNGLPYTSIGRQLIADGEFSAENMTLEALGQWLKADQARGKAAMWKNESYVFFKQIALEQTQGPLGVDNTTLIPGRSLAVDTSFHPLGTPIFVQSPELSKNPGFRRLMIAQDVGSAITGPERGDIFYGTGEKAGKLAGDTKHAARFTVLHPSQEIGRIGETGERS